MKLAGKLSISRRTSNVEPEYFVIEIEDAASGIDAVRVYASPADLALAISGRANLPVEAEWCVDNLGKRSETKTEIVRCNGVGMTGKQKRAACAPFEVDGWMAAAEDIGNGHRREGDGYRVTFRRWVTP